MIPDLTESWNEILAEELKSPEFQNTMRLLNQEYEEGFSIFPPKEQVFSVFQNTSFQNVKVVILGQDPYHQVGQAHGFSFSVSPGVKIPPSLRNIYKELFHDIEGFQMPGHGCLEYWVDQGVLLLNAILTVRENEAGSHSKMGWEYFTNAVIRKLSQKRTNLVFLLWGNFARSKKVWIDDNKHLVLEATHPSPLAGNGFQGSKHFSQTNHYLRSKNIKEIDWQIPVLPFK